MDLVEEEDLEEMAVILEAKEEVGRGGEKRLEEGMKGNERVGNPEEGKTPKGGNGETWRENGTPANPGVKPSECRSAGARTIQLNVDLAKKVTESLDLTECNVDSKKDEKHGAGRNNSEGEIVEKKEEEERKNSLRGKRMPAWVRRESIQWESSQREIFGVQESLLKGEKNDLKEFSTSKEDGEVDVKSQNESLHSESLKIEGKSQVEEERVRKESEQAKENREDSGGIKMGQATGLAWNEEEKEEVDFCKVEEKLSEWRRRRKSGREEEVDRVR